MIERLLGMKGRPLCEDRLAVAGQKDIILQKNAFGRDDTFAVELQSIHDRFLSARGICQSMFRISRYKFCRY